MFFASRSKNHISHECTRIHAHDIVAFVLRTLEIFAHRKDFLASPFVAAFSAASAHDPGKTRKGQPAPNANLGFVLRLGVWAVNGHSPHSGCGPAAPCSLV